MTDKQTGVTKESEHSEHVSQISIVEDAKEMFDCLLDTESEEPTIQEEVDNSDAYDGEDMEELFNAVAGPLTHKGLRHIRGYDSMSKTEKTRAMLEAPKYIDKDVWDKKLDRYYSKDVRFIVRLTPKEARVIDDWSHKHGHKADIGPQEILRAFAREWAKKIGKNGYTK